MTRTFPVSDRRPLPCPAPGVYEGVPAAEYHQWAAMHSTALSAWCESGLEGAYQWTAGEASETAYMQLGTLFHAAVLEPERFDAEAIERPDVDRRTKEGKAAHAAFVETVGDNTLVAEPGELALVRSMRDALFAHPRGKALKARARRELSIVWDDPDLGFRCKARLDFYHDSGAIVDLKTTSKVAVGLFNNHASNLGYHRQAAWYLRGAVMAGLSVEQGHWTIAVQSAPPFDVLVCDWAEAVLDQAWAEIEVAADRVCAWLDGKPVSGVSADVVTLTLPAWKTTTQAPRNRGWLRGEVVA